MSGWLSSTLPSYTLPFTGSERVVIDTGLASGASPQTAAISVQNLASVGLGAVTAATYATINTLNASTASFFSLTLTASGSTITMSNASPGQEVLLALTQDATGSRTVSTWTNVLWAGGTAPTLTVTASATDLFRFTWDATLGKWFGETVGKAFA